MILVHIYSPLFLRARHNSSPEPIQTRSASFTTLRPLPPPTIIMSSRLGFRFFQNSRAAYQNASSPFRRNAFRGRRFQSTESGSADATASQSTFQRLWNSPVGVKTVHFWYGIPDSLYTFRGPYLCFFFFSEGIGLLTVPLVFRAPVMKVI